LQVFERMQHLGKIEAGKEPVSFSKG
jgi:hypothetical protein